MPLKGDENGHIGLEVGLIKVNDDPCLHLTFNDDEAWVMPFSLIAEHFMLEYEILERGVIDILYTERDRVLEAGSGLGVTGLAILRTGAELIAYEPQKRLIGLLEVVFGMNDFQGIPLVCAAIAPRTGQVELADWGISYGRSILEQMGETTTVPCVGVNEAIEMHGANALHMDVEGVECHILEALDWSLIDKLSLEVHSSMIGHGMFDDTIKRLAHENGFELHCSAGMEANYPRHNYAVGFRRKKNGKT